MVKEAEANAAEDARRRQEIELRNQADALVYSDRAHAGRARAPSSPTPSARAVEQALSEAREALKGEDGDASGARRTA